MADIELANEKLNLVVHDLIAALDYMRSFNPAIQDRVDMLYLETKIGHALGFLLQLDTAISKIKTFDISKLLL